MFDTTKYQHVAKAVAAFLAGAATVAAVAVSLSSDGGLSTADWFAIGSSIVGAFAGTGAVYQTTNQPKV